MHLFNWIGYKAFFYYSAAKNDQLTSLHIESKQYNDDDLVLVKVPVALPYTQQTSDYERYDGEIEWGGQHYNYVKRMISTDTLFLLCLPDKNRTAISDAKNSYASHVNDLPVNKKAADAPVKKSVFSTDFESWPEWSSSKKMLNTPGIENGLYLGSLLYTYILGDIQPPDRTVA